jgi:enoyl-CoA hydratase/carnithine racemase
VSTDTDVVDLGVVRYEKSGPIARLILNAPQRANAQTSEMVHRFDDALTLAERDYDVKVLIVKANGKGFCAGHSIPAGPEVYPEFAEEHEALGTYWKSAADLFLTPVYRLWEFPKPTIAQVHGYAIGGGTYWALLPDITIAADDAYFQMPLVQGLGFPGGETMIEPWLMMNWKRAYEYLYTAQTVTAGEALGLGMVNRVVPNDELEATTEQLARDIAKAPLSTLMATKQLVGRAWELMGMRMHWRMSNDLMTVTGHTSDAMALREQLMQRGQRPRDLTGG